MNFNLGVSSFGEKEVVNIIKSVYEAYDCKFPIVSVGSGTGDLEYLFSESTGYPEIMCIDPDPTSFLGKYIFIQPKYKYVKDMIKSEPSMVGNCILLLNWCEPNDSLYDYEAVMLCKPVAILTIIERYNKSGVAGGNKFREFLDESGASSDWTSTTEYSIAAQIYVADSEVEENPPDVQCIWLNRKDVKYNEDIAYALPVGIPMKFRLPFMYWQI